MITKEDILEGIINAVLQNRRMGLSTDTEYYEEPAIRYDAETDTEYQVEQDGPLFLAGWNYNFESGEVLLFTPEAFLEECANDGDDTAAIIRAAYDGTEPMPSREEIEEWARECAQNGDFDSVLTAFTCIFEHVA